MKLILRFVDICLFRAGPADVPASSWLMNVSLSLYFLTGLVVGRIDSHWIASLCSSVVDMSLLMLTAWLLLTLRGQLVRYTQTVIALAGTGTLLGLIGLPILWLFSQVDEHSQPASLILLAIMMLMFWSLMVTAHIFRQALDIKAGTAAIITVVYTLISMLAVMLVMSGVA